MPFAIGLSALKRLCQEQTPLKWQQAKLSAPLFKANEVAVYQWVEEFISSHHTLPQVATLESLFPDLQLVQVVEPASYYVEQLENRFFYDQWSKTGTDIIGLLKENPDAHASIMELVRARMRTIVEQRFRARILNVKQELYPTIIEAYYHLVDSNVKGAFGWPYLDQQGGVAAGDVISFVGRPATGKTWLTLWTALYNWRLKHLNVLFVSMEMTTLPIAQRLAAMYAHQNVTQLKASAYSSTTFKKFAVSLKSVIKEHAEFYVIDGNLAANVEDIFSMAELLQCPIVIIDGAYLLRHTNPRLDRFTRAAENVELIKRLCTDTEKIAFCSWQFNRAASQKQKKGTEKADLEDIGYTDAIGQISSLVLSVYQEEGVETMKERKIQVLKGRSGETGEFTIQWEFMTMDFDQLHPAVQTEVEHDPNEELLAWS